MKKLLKTLFMLCIIASLAVSGATVFADATDNTVAEAAEPRTMYYLSGSLGIVDGTNCVYVKVSTSAFDYIDSIYHDVRIYKNGSLYSSRRYSDTDCQTLSTQITVPANSGDFIEVQVDHYTKHNNIVESGYNEDTYIY